MPMNVDACQSHLYNKSIRMATNHGSRTSILFALALEAESEARKVTRASNSFSFSFINPSELRFLWACLPANETGLAKRTPIKKRLVCALCESLIWLLPWRAGSSSLVDFLQLFHQGTLADHMLRVAVARCRPALCAAAPVQPSAL